MDAESAMVVDTSTSSSCITTLPVYRHADEPQVAAVAEATHSAWLKRVPALDRNYSAGPCGNYFALTWPYGKIERVKLAAEIVQTLWMYDDIAENLPRDEAVAAHEKFYDTILDKYADRLTRLDEEGAPVVLASLKSYLQVYDSTAIPVSCIEDYIERRVGNVGFWIMEFLMQWTVGRYLTGSERESCCEFSRTAGRTMALTNDLYSWNVEREAMASSNGATNRRWNAIPVIQQQFGLDEESATVYLKGLVVQYEQATKRLGASIKMQCTDSIMGYVIAAEAMIGGNCFWSSNCPRYNTTSH